MNPLNLTDQETVGLKAIVACVMEFGLLVTVCVCMLYRIPLDSALFIEAAGFVCAVAGIAYTGFRTQRLTDYGYVEKKGQADAQVAEATKATLPTPVVQPPAAAVEIHP
jgi:hypothetical protein